MTDQLFEHAVRDWLDDGSDRTPPAAIDAVLLAVKTTPQERDLTIPRRFTQMPASSRLAAVAAIVAAVGIGALLVAGGRHNVPPATSPSPAPSPTRPATAGWVAFISERYGYSVERPPDWEANAASRDWAMELDRTDWLSPAQDQFIDEQASYQIGIHGFAVDLPSGTLPDAWIDAFFEGATPESGCLAVAADLPTIVVGSYAGKLADQEACSDAIAFVPVNARMFVFTIGRAGQLQLFEAFLSTVHFKPGVAGRLYTGDWPVYNSAQYGFTLGHPPGWSEIPAIRPWAYKEDGADFLTAAADAFRTPEGDVRVSAWVVPFGASEPEQSWASVRAWLEDYCSRTDISSCAVIHDRAEQLCVEVRDCHPGLLVAFDTSVQAFFFGGVAPPGGMSVVSVWLPENAAETARFGGSKRLLEAFLATMNVWPEARRPENQDAIWPPPSRTPA